MVKPLNIQQYGNYIKYNQHTWKHYLHRKMLKILTLGFMFLISTPKDTLFFHHENNFDA